MTTAPDQQTFDQILEQTFPKDIQQKRIRKELISLNDLDQNYYKINLQNSSLGLKVVVEFTELFIQREIQQNSNLQLPIILELLLDPQFPFNLPKLFCRTPIFQPSLADGRDFLENAIERPWSPTILLREVITSIPTFLKKINRLQNPADSQKMGQYYIGDLYSLEDMLGYETCNLFTGEEVIEKKATAPRYIVVAESHFLKFETADNSRNTLRLLTWANLNSIANIKRSKDDQRSLLITFLDKEKTNGIAQLMLLTKESNRLEELLLDLGERYGAKIKQGAISDFDLTPYTAKLSRQITEKNVEEALEDIHQLETRLEIEVTKDLVYTLMAFYQKTVEHFANYDDPLVDEFVSKLRSLMEREDVQTALKNNQENEERKRTQTLTKQKSMDTDIEDEEEKKESNEPYSWQDQDDNNASLDGGNDRIVISQSQKLEVQRPAPVQEEVKNQQQEENEWNEYESKGTEEAEKEPEFVENKPQQEVYEAQEHFENRQKEQYVEPQYQAQEQQEEYIPAQEEAQYEQKGQEEVVENQENKEDEFEGYQQEQQQAQEYQQNVQEEQHEAPIQQEEQFEGYQQEQQQAQEFQQEEYQQNVQEEQVEAPVQQEEEVPIQNEEPVVQEVVPEQKEEEIQREEEQQEEVQVQEDKQEEAVENKQEEAVQENEEKIVNEPVEEKEEAVENKEEVQVQENKEEEAIAQNEEPVVEEVVPEQKEEEVQVQENKEEEAPVENEEPVVPEQKEEEVQKEEQTENIEAKPEIEENKNEEEVAKVEENQEEQSPEKAEAETHENEGEVEGEEEAQTQEGQGEGNKKKKNKKKKNKK